MSATNKRTIPRLEFSEPVRIHLTQEKSGKIEHLESEAQGVDISSHGLGLLTTPALKKGDILKVILPSRADGAVLPVFSQVVWARKNNDQYRVGLQFLS